MPLGRCAAKAGCRQAVEPGVHAVHKQDTNARGGNEAIGLFPPAQPQRFWKKTRHMPSKVRVAVDALVADVSRMLGADSEQAHLHEN